MNPLDGITLAIMARYPEPGRVKTRLTPELTPQQAAGVYEVFLRHLVHRLAPMGWGELMICHDPPDCADRMRQLLADQLRDGQARFVAQCDGDLGDRLSEAVRLEARNRPNVLFLGVDSPDVPIGHLIHTAELLRCNDIVIGPAEDGGYWTIGFGPQVKPLQLFAGIEWSSGREYAQTIAAATRLGYKVGLAGRWRDIDRVEDLRRLIERLTGSDEADDRRLLDRFIRRVGNIEAFSGPSGEARSKLRG